MSKNERIAKDHYKMYQNSRLYSLWDCYSSFSRAKENAFEYCKNLCYELNGYGLKIISYNSNFFSVGFEYADENTGALRFMYITKNYNRSCEV